MVESGAAVELKEEPLVDGGLPDAGAAVVAKKTNQNVPDEVKVHAYQKNRFGWPLTRSWEKACQLAPDFSLQGWQEDCFQVEVSRHSSCSERATQEA